MSKDRRKFRRYYKKSPMKIFLGDASVDAESVDYSLDGIAAFVPDGDSLHIGDEIKLDLAALNAKLTGRIVRAQRTVGGYMVAISRTGILSGRVEDFSLGDILLGIHRSGKTGLLHFTSGKVHKVVYLKDGDMIFASSNLRTDWLGDLLLQAGKITKEQYDESTEQMKKTHRRHGVVMVEMGFIDAKTLQWAIKTAVENVIVSLFAYREGNFMFHEGPLPTSERVTLRLSVANLIYRGMKRIRDTKYLEFLCPPINTALALSTDPMNLYQDVHLMEADRRVLTLVDSTRTIEDIIEQSGQPGHDVLSCLAALIAFGMVEVKDENHEDAPPVAPESISEKPRASMQQDILNSIENMYQACRSGSYYDVLSVTKNSTKDAIKRSYYRLAKEFHPDRHYTLPEDMKDKLTAIFTTLHTAYNTLTSDAQRAHYDSMAAKEKISPKDTAALAEENYQKGREAFAMGNYTQAERLFAEAAYLDANNHKFHFQHGLSMAKLGKFKDAERALRRALMGDPFNADYLAEIGFVYLKLDLQLRAKGSFERALRFRLGHKRAMEGMRRVQQSVPQ